MTSALALAQVGRWLLAPAYTGTAHCVGRDALVLRRAPWPYSGATIMTADAREIIAGLRNRKPLELTRPQRAHDAKLTDRIADLKLHPAIEVGLHLLNDDLYSAHFVWRAPASPISCVPGF